MNTFLAVVNLGSSVCVAFAKRLLSVCVAFARPKGTLFKRLQVTLSESLQGVGPLKTQTLGKPCEVVVFTKFYNLQFMYIYICL